MTTRRRGSLPVDGDTGLLRQNTNTGKVAWWRVNDAAQLVDSTQDSGWGFVSQDSVSSNWTLVE